MTFKERMRLIFQKSKCVKVFLYHKDMRVTEHVVIPEDGKIAINGKGYVIDSTRVFAHKGIPSLAYAEETAEPINPLDISKSSKLSSKDFYNAIENTVIQDVIKQSQETDDTAKYAIVGGLISLLAVGAGAYFISEMIGELFVEIENLKETIELMNGGDYDY